MTEKNKLRILYKSIRDTITETEKKDSENRIFSLLVNSDIFKKSNLILSYVSFGSEIDTMNIIEYSLNNNKSIAVPICVGKDMFFYEINSLSELKTGKFGIPTVDIGKSKIITEFDNALCIVPAVCYDFFGHRIGYGGGYYDRFLSQHSVKTVGLCFERCICNSLPIEEYDKSVNFILSENKLRNSETKGGSTYE